MVDKEKHKLRSILNILLAFAVIFFLLTPVFEVNGSHFGWGFAVLMLVGLPLMLITPIFLGLQIYQFKKKAPNTVEILITISTFLLWVMTIIRFS